MLTLFEIDEAMHSKLQEKATIFQWFYTFFNGKTTVQL